jgi:hypothetical protein
MRSPVARLVVTGIIPLLPQAGYEVNASLIDAHWYLVIALFWVLLVPPRTLRGQVLASILALATALSDPLAVIAVLPAVVVLIRNRHWFPDLIAPVVLVAALCLQEWVHLHQEMLRLTHTVPGSIPEIFGLRVLLNALVGDRYLGSVYDALGPAAIVAATALLAAVVIGLARRSRGPSILYAVVFFLGAAIMTGTELALRGTGGYLTRDPFDVFPSRYFIVPIIFLWSGIAVLVDGRRIRPNDGASTRIPRTELGRWGAAVLAVVVLGEVIVGYSTRTIRTHHTTWSSNLRYMEAACRRPADPRGLRVEARVGEHAGARDAPVPIGPADVTVYPDGAPAPGQRPWFALVLPCSRVLQS